MKGGVYDNEKIFGYNAYLGSGAFVNADNRLPED
jgi:hypothetical protein